jgi:hypothetical protein
MFLQEKAVVETTKQKEEKRKNLKARGTGRHASTASARPPEKRRGDRNPKYHEEQLKDVV